MDEKKPSPGRDSSLQKTRRMTGLAIFSAIIVVIQIVCTFVRFGPFSITLALAPIIIGTALYGVVTWRDLRTGELKPLDLPIG